MRIAIDGITGSGKTALTKSIRKKFAENSPHSLLFLSHDYTQRLAEHFPSPVRGNKALEILGLYLRMLSESDQLFNQSNFQHRSETRNRRMGAILEGFSWNISLEYGADKSSISRLDDWMNELGFFVLLLTIDYSEIYERSVRLPRISRGDRWNNYVKAKQLSDLELTAYYAEEQEKLIARSVEGGLRVLTLKTGEMDWDGYAETILQTAR